MARAKTREERISLLMHDGEKLFYASEIRKKALWLPLILACLGLAVALHPAFVTDFAEHINKDLGIVTSKLLTTEAGRFLGVIIIVMAVASGAASGTQRRNNLTFITNQRVVRVTGLFDPEVREFYLNRIGFIKLKRTFWERVSSTGHLLVFDNSWSLNSKQESGAHCIHLENIYFPDRFRSKLKDAIERYKDVAAERERENPSMEKFHLQAEFSHGSRGRKGRSKQQQRRGSGGSRRRK